MKWLTYSHTQNNLHVCKLLYLNFYCYTVQGSHYFNFSGDTKKLLLDLLLLNIKHKAFTSLWRINQYLFSCFYYYHLIFQTPDRRIFLTISLVGFEYFPSFSPTFEHSFLTSTSKRELREERSLNVNATKTIFSTLDKTFHRIFSSAFTISKRLL